MTEIKTTAVFTVQYFQYYIGDLQKCKADTKIAANAEAKMHKLAYWLYTSTNHLMF